MWIIINVGKKEDFLNLQFSSTRIGKHFRHIILHKILPISSFQPKNRHEAPSLPSVLSGCASCPLPNASLHATPATYPPIKSVACSKLGCDHQCTRFSKRSFHFGCVQIEPKCSSALLFIHKKNSWTSIKLKKNSQLINDKRAISLNLVLPQISWFCFYHAVKITS